MKEKNLSIEFIKFIALFIIANSHMEILYGKFSFLATGGSIGDALFFFCSGYTLFLGRHDRFDNWYKRRISRIYPSVFAWALVASIFFNLHMDMKNIWLHGGGWFVSCIMLYYVVLYLIRKYLIEKKWLTFSIITIIILICYSFEDIDSFFMYGETYFKWVHYFLFMVLGAYIGARKISLTIRPLYDWLGFIFCFFTYYIFLFACTKSTLISQWQIMTLFPLIGISIYLYKICNSPKLISFIKNKEKIICCISGLCLESYIVQYSLFTDKLNYLFPLNILITIIAILIMAYLIRLIGRFFVQVFNPENFDWKSIIRL